MKEKENRQYIVYMHTNKTNNKKYIGITSMTAAQRWHRGEGYKRQLIFYRAIQKYGWDGFEHEILFSGLTEEQAKTKEIELIKKYDTMNLEKGYNRTEGGDSGLERSEETRKKISDTVNAYYTTEEGQKFKEHLSELASQRTGEKNPFYGKKHTDETKEKIKKGRAAYNVPVNMYDENHKLIRVFDTKKDAIHFVGIKSSTVGLEKAMEQDIMYKGYYWAKNHGEVVEED